jgi:hypothetical protein
MSSRFTAVLALFAGVFQAVAAAADEPQATATPVVAQPYTDRVILGVDGTTLTGTNGGVGGNIAFLHQAGIDRPLVGVGAEYDRLATADWAFGSLNVALSHPMTANTRWSMHAEAHEGAGTSAGRAFDYSIVAAGMGAALPGEVAMDFEERQIDVYTSHGSLPKAALSKAWGRHLLTSVAYARSFGGNLDTSYTLGRIDIYGPGFNLIAGGDFGRVSPAVVNINGILTAEARHLKEVFGGVTKPFSRLDVALLADNIDLAGIRHFTLTLNCTVRLQ